jgi:hypothetical protein
MNKPFKFTLSGARRVTYVVVATLLTAATVPFLEFGHASAAQLQSRSIQLSDSSVSGGSIASGVGSGTGVTYLVSFTTSSAGAAGSLVIDFCSQDPIINDTCSAPTGMVATGAVLNATVPGTCASSTVQTTTDNWAVTASASQIKLADDNTAGGHPTHDMQASTNECFYLTGITNPSTLGTFYARIYTFPFNAWLNYTSATNIGTSYIDYGGIALSTTNPITITARVQEQLTFCVTNTDPTANGTGWTGPNPSPSIDGCSATNLTAPALTLGHGSPTLVLDTTATDTASVWTDLSTNATHGAVIDMRNSNLTCTGPGGAGGLSADGGTTCAIPPVNNGAVGPSPINHGTAAFGMWCGTDPVTGVGTIGSIPCTADYDDGTHTPSAPPIYYGMDTGGGAAGVVGTYGDTVASTTSPTYNAFNEYVFGATASLTTPAGIYNANLSLIATGTF